MSVLLHLVVGRYPCHQSGTDHLDLGSAELQPRTSMFHSHTQCIKINFSDDTLLELNMLSETFLS